MSLTYSTAYAQVDMGAIGQQGQAFGNELITQWKNNKPTASGNVLTVPGTTTPLNIKDLYPGTSSSSEKPASFYFPDEYEQDQAKYESIYDSGSAMDNAGSNAQAALWDDATRENPTSLQGSAYKIILDTMNRSRPDMRTDPMFNTARDTLMNMDEWHQQFGDCSSETQITKTTKVTHVPEYERCERLVKPSGDCQINHEIGISRQTFNVFVAAAGRDVLTVKFDLKTGAWQTISPTDGAAFSASIPSVDYNAVCGSESILASRGQNGGIWNWTGHGLGGNLDTSVYHEVLQFPTCQNNLEGIVQIWDSTTGSSDTDYILGAQFALVLESLTKDEWSPEQCLNDAKYIDDGFCSASLTGLVGPNPDTGCVSVSGALICPGDTFYNAMKPPPSAQIPKLALSVHLSELNCGYNEGSMSCWTDINGDLQCPSNAGNELDSCGTLDANPQCGFIKSECLQGATGPSGQCYVFEDTYDCGYDVSVPNFVKEQVYQCAGPIKCMGTDCIDVSWDQNNDFGKAAALLNAAQFMAQDMDCSEQEHNPDDDDPKLGCMIFPGKAGDCKKAVGGVVNCCEKPSGISLADYVTLLMAVPKLDTAITAVGGWGGGNAIGSSYKALKDPIMKGWSEISQPFVNATDGISGVFDKIGQAYDSVLQGLENSIAQLYDKAFGTMATEAGVGTGLGEVAVGAGSEVAKDGAMAQVSQKAAEFATQAMGVISFISTIYSIYSVTMLAIKMIYKCTDDELEMNVKRTLKSCSYVGSYCASEILGVCIEKRESYCCFASPLSRIIQEQARPQLGMDFGDPENPSCAGLTADQIAGIDWNLINLDEWLGILQSTGNWAAGGNLDISSMTGANTTLDLGARVDAEERAQKRLEETDIDAKRIELEHTYRPYQGG